MGQQRQSLKQILAAQSWCLAVPGCYDGLSARLIEQAGFPVAFLSGGAHAMGRFGLPDMGFVSLTQLADAVSAITECTNLALIVDADTGFGNALNTAHAVRMLERAGASAIQIEDQVAPKRCGHMAGKSVIAPDLAAGKIKAAVDARHCAQTFVLGRTDAASIEGLEAALDRADLYFQAGADLIFVEGPSSLEDMAAIQSRFEGRVPLVHNMVGGGVNPVTSNHQLTEFGYSIALHPLALLHNFVTSAQTTLASLRHQQARPAVDELRTLNGTVDTQAFLKAASTYQ
jgi:2-methylisocitrate lyase-like PEP mutase family enzyme